jgi:hypothetical protein
VLPCPYRCLLLSPPPLPPQLDRVWSFESWANPAFMICFVLAGVMGVILQYSTYLCTQVGPRACAREPAHTSHPRTLTATSRTLLRPPLAPPFTPFVSWDLGGRHSTLTHCWLS